MYARGRSKILSVLVNTENHPRRATISELEGNVGGNPNQIVWLSFNQRLLEGSIGKVVNYLKFDGEY